MEEKLAAKEYQMSVTADKALWDHFNRHSPQGCVFMDSRLLDCLGCKYELLILKEDQDIVCSTVIFYDDKGGVMSNPFMYYQGVMLADFRQLPLHSRLHKEFTVLTRMTEELVSRYSELTFTHSWKLEDMRSFQWVNYHDPSRGVFDVKLRYTAITDLNGYERFDQYLKDIRTLRKRELKKAFDMIIEDTDEIEEFLDLHNLTYLRQGIETVEKIDGFRKKFIQGCLSKGIGRMKRITDQSGKTASISLFLYDDSTAYYLFGANHPDFRQSGAATTLMLHFIEDAMNQGKKFIDFCGVNSPNRGDYKISFNAKLHPYFLTSYKKSNNNN